jgi:hypothetical protein
VGGKEKEADLFLDPSSPTFAALDRREALLDVEIGRKENVDEH